MANTIISETELSPIVHVCCRDRSFLGLQSHLLGAHVLGVRDLVVITGDPPKMGPYPNSTGVYDLDSIDDRLLYRDDERRAYLPLSAEVAERIQAGQIRF